MTDSTKKTPNRLINETSPYLLRHAYNPVDWYPWGNEAFEKARLEDKPVFLLLGIAEHGYFDEHAICENAVDGTALYNT